MITQPYISWMRFVAIFIFSFLLSQAGLAVKEGSPQKIGTFLLDIQKDRRIIAIGDLHGDMKATRSALKLGKLIDDQDHWIGEDTIVVQVGDLLDRGPDDRAVFDLFEKLAEEAPKAGGLCISLIGNHEIMNVNSDFRHVEPDAFKDFREFDPQCGKSLLSFSCSPGVGGRRIAFSPGGPYARKLATHNMIVVIRDTVFVHGGVSLEYAQYGIEKINQEVTEWLLGQLETQPNSIKDKDGPIWDRRLGRNTQAWACDELEKTLTLLNCKRMVVGHTVQPAINAACHPNKVWRIDCGMCSHYGGPIEILEIIGDEVRVLHSVSHKSTQPNYNIFWDNPPKASIR